MNKVTQKDIEKKVSQDRLGDLKKQNKRLEKTAENLKIRLKDRRKKIQYLMVTSSDLEKSRDLWRQKAEEFQSKMAEKDVLLLAKDIEMERMEAELNFKKKREKQLLAQLNNATQIFSKHQDEFIEFKKNSRNN